jgi:NitT/TauT family transport system ATP-binding protein
VHEALIELKGVERRYANGWLALGGVDLSIAPHSFVSLLGPSGCGKSTVLRLLAGLDAPTAGTIRRPAGHEAEIGFVFQEPTLMPWATVRDNVGLPLKLKRQARADIAARVAPALVAVGLAGFEDAMPRELSGGMKMRVSIARALVTRPALLLLDEPFAALDEITRFRLNQDLLRLWQQDSFTGVFVTHSAYEAVFLSQRIVVMGTRPGRIVEEIVIDEPYPRSADFRASPRYAAWCVQVSQALQRVTADV